jgi:ABC-type Na+ efflux pump permease subunit
MATLAILRNDLSCYLRDKPALFWTFIGPIVCITLFGYLTQPQAGPAPTIALIDRDTGEVGDRLQQNLDVLGYKVHRTATGDPNEWRVEIQRDVTASTAGAQPVRMTLHGGAQESAQERSVRFDLESAIARLSVPDGSSGAIEIATGRSGATPQKVTRGFQRTVPAYLIMFLTLNLLVAGANLAEDRQNGRLRRMLLSPAGKPSVILGKLMARLAVGWTQMALVLATGVLVFRVTFAAHPVLLVAFLSLYALAIGAVGILIGALFRDPDQAHTVAIWTTIVLAPLSGISWPVETMPAPLRLLADCLPMGWAMRAVNAMLAFNAGPADIAWQALALTSLLIFSFTLASVRLRAT